MMQEHARKENKMADKTKWLTKPTSLPEVEAGTIQAVVWQNVIVPFVVERLTKFWLLNLEKIDVDSMKSHVEVMRKWKCMSLNRQILENE